ncbi:MAG: glycosyltransferase [Prevotellaceae bacterium]|jgi:glycosyltransferase involved in cell wall biosynthesis|nr:glycosyltransferase [Prevotellaceae bacterium]
MFSVIIPLYNKAQYVEKALQSVANQTFKEFEVIVVDDGSTDNSLEIVKNMRGINCELRIIEQANSGVSTARNNGVRVARYNYIVFLDADDWWADNFLAQMAALINDFPDAAMWASSYFKVKNGKVTPAKIGVSQDFTRGYFDYVMAYSRSPWMPIWTGATVMRKEIYDEMGGFKPTLKLGEDFDLWMRVALKYRTVLINKPLSFYNQDVEAATRGVRMHKTEHHFLFNLQYFENQAVTNQQLKQLLDNLRVYGLFPYFLQKSTRNQTLAELQKVDWIKQPKSEYRKYYKTPVWWLKTKMFVMKILSTIKQKLTKFEIKRLQIGIVNQFQYGII